MIDLKLDEITHDLTIVSDDLQLTSLITQRLTQILKLWRGDWFLDESLGVPWLDILGQRPDEKLTAEIIRDAVMQDPDVVNVSDIRLTVDEERAARVTMTVQTRDAGRETIEVQIG